MALPIHIVVRPALLAGLTNGALPASVLWDTSGQAGGPLVRLVAPAARAWRAMAAAALKAGHVLKATSLVDSYRPYPVQESVFRQRYTTTFLEGRPYRIWNGARWYQRAGTAPAAVPGTSNHGWGLAVDVGEERDADTGTESMDAATLAWLIANEFAYGFSHELESEPWHVRYWAGDTVPSAVLIYELGGIAMTAADVWSYDPGDPAAPGAVLNQPFSSNYLTKKTVTPRWALGESWRYGHDNEARLVRIEATLKRVQETLDAILGFGGAGAAQVEALLNRTTLAVRPPSDPGSGP
jgi:hypothetical protein